MKKVGIITYQDIADGKGRFLQAYALYTAINVLGYDAEIIDYFPFSLEEKINRTLSKKLIGLMKNPTLLPGYIVKLQECIMNKIIKKKVNQKREKYESFIHENIKITNKKYYGYKSILEANLTYDAFVCGSDQIWNPYFQGNDSTYYLQFVPKEKRIAYAPSLGTIQIDDDKKEIIKSMISEIPFVSVREVSGAKLVESIIGRNVKSVVDPTLLLPKKWWFDFANETIKDKPYILTFLFDNSSFPRNVANKLAKKYGWKIVSIPDTLRDIFSFNNKEIGIGPERFVSLFKNAAFVCTQSFHGTVLSLIYNRPFYVFDRETRIYISGMFSRINDLLVMLKLEDRILKDGEAIPQNNLEIDFSHSNNILERKRKKSLEYLQYSLQQVTGG
jgi:hypothetical protein